MAPGGSFPPGFFLNYQLEIMNYGFVRRLTQRSLYNFLKDDLCE